MKKEDYEEFLQYLDYQGLDVQGYIEDFDKVKDILTEICFKFSGRRIHFKSEQEIFGIKALGLVINGSPTIITYHNLRLAVRADNALGFVAKKIPYDIEFVKELNRIVDREKC